MSQVQELPPDPLTQTKHRMAELAADTAKDLAMREARSWVKSYLPRFLWPLIAGEKGTVAGNVKAGISRWFWGLVSSAVVSLVFLAFFALAFLGFALVIAYALLTS